MEALRVSAETGGRADGRCALAGVASAHPVRWGGAKRMGARPLAGARPAVGETPSPPLRSKCPGRASGRFRAGARDRGRRGARDRAGDILWWWGTLRTMQAVGWVGTETVVLLSVPECRF